MYKRLFLMTLAVIAAAWSAPVVLAGGDEEDRDRRYADSVAEIDAELTELEIEAKYYEKINEIERDRPRHPHAGPPDEGLSEVHRELIQLDDELERELLKADQELDRELQQIHAEAATEGDREKYSRKRYELEIKHYEKIMKIEEKYAKKRGEILGGRGGHERGERSWKQRRNKR